MMQCMQVNPTNHNHSRRFQRQPTTQSRNPNQCKYCWTHGWCNHFGRDCRSKAEDHRDEVTIENRMGGSTRNIHPEWLIERKIVAVDNDNHSNNHIIKSTSRHTYVAHKTKKSVHAVAKADTGASKHYFAPRGKRTLLHIKKLTSSPNIHLPNNETIHATETGKLYIHPSLTESALQVQIFPN